jgi:cyanophycinase
MGYYNKGNLVIIGGAEDKYGESKILEEVVEIIGGENARIGIITTATLHPEQVGEEYRDVFLRLGVKKTDILNINTRDEANLDDNVQRIRDVTGFFFTGGDQLRITSILGGTKAYEAIHQSFNQGTAVIGTSAGASVMSSTMIIEGNNNDAARKCTLKMAPGLSLLEGVIIDQHFDQRGRLGRLLCGIAENPGILGIGIDEDTAIRVYPEEYFEVLGNNAVTVIDGKSIKSTNVSELQPDEILTITNASIHVLSKGYGFDLKKWEVLRLH